MTDKLDDGDRIFVELKRFIFSCSHHFLGISEKNVAQR